MLSRIFTGIPYNVLSLMGVMFCFVMTTVLLAKCSDKLPKDHGREYAVNGTLSAGKPRGAGFIFVLVFIAGVVVFGDIDKEVLIYLVLVAAAMMTGFLDDCAKTSWGEYKKGLLDMVIAVLVAVTFLHFNSNVVELAFMDVSFAIPSVVFGILTVILVWVSINVTNCSDGVDGLSGSLAIVTLMSLYMVDEILDKAAIFSSTIPMFVVCLLAYLWFNATPSKLMMGDAGSRAMGFFISVAALKTGDPFIYIPLAIVLILDGGLGIIKVSLLRFLKIKILVNTRTPLHDHVRKNKDWSNTQTVFRFVIIQIMVAVVVLCLIIK